jgi:hypothetical protein
VIRLVDERQWEDVNWNSQGHQTCVNMELETSFQLLYPAWFSCAIDERLRGCGPTRRSGSMLTNAPFWIL